MQDFINDWVDVNSLKSTFKSMECFNQVTLTCEKIHETPCKDTKCVRLRKYILGGHQYLIYLRPYC